MLKVNDEDGDNPCDHSKDLLMSSSSLSSKKNDDKVKGKLEMQEGNDEDNTNHCHSLQDMPPSSSSKVMKIATNIGQLPYDMLKIISNKLDIDELYAFGGVCNEWRSSFTTLRAQFMDSQAPLVVKMTQNFESTVSFISIHEGKSYNTKLPAEVTGCFYSWYGGVSNGYLIIRSKVDNTLYLINPFMRTKKQIPGPPEQDGVMHSPYNYLAVLGLACVVDSEDFVIVSRSRGPSMNLLVYQSRNSCWENYLSTSSKGFSNNVMDVAVLNGTLYAIDGAGKIGILSLNSPSVKILQLNNAPRVRFFRAKLASSEGQLLVVKLLSSAMVHRIKIYKIDFTTMKWVRLESLGDLALLWRYNKCYALSNPGKWGYDNNCVYFFESRSLTCQVYSMTNGLIRSILLAQNQPSYGTWRDNPYMLDWYFRHIRDEVDYSLDD